MMCHLFFQKKFGLINLKKPTRGPFFDGPSAWPKLLSPTPNLICFYFLFFFIFLIIIFYVFLYNF